MGNILVSLGYSTKVLQLGHSGKITGMYSVVIWGRKNFERQGVNRDASPFRCSGRSSLFWLLQAVLGLWSYHSHVGFNLYTDFSVM